MAMEVAHHGRADLFALFTVIITYWDLVFVQRQLQQYGLLSNTEC